MNRAALLHKLLEEFGQNIHIENWSVNDDVLCDEIEIFLNESLTLDADSLQRGRYLAEAICFDSFGHNNLTQNVKQYINRYASINFPGDKVRLEAVERLCNDASSSHKNTKSELLLELLSEQLNDSYCEHVRNHPTLQHMKDTGKAIRVGDVVFLPKNAEIIVIGDTHGDLASTKHIISEIYTSEAIERGAYIVFLGDYTSNGVKSWQNLIEILRFKKSHPQSVILLSGNHEFKESYLTALNEYLNVHWNRFTTDELPNGLHDRMPQLDNHYGHLRLDLIRSFGFDEGEHIYSLCAEWGLSLPYICISDNLMLSHSLGKHNQCELQLPQLLYGKQDDVESIRRLGYETWNARRDSLHSNLINNRSISAKLLADFNRALDVNEFVVGHCHYRSGDTLRLDNNIVTTVISSSPLSPDSGHYMYQQMIVERREQRHAENLSTEDAVAGYLHYTITADSPRERKLSRIDKFW